MNTVTGSNGMPLIRLESYSKNYGAVSAVHDANIAIEAGEFIAITGPSGSGKTTLLGMLGLLESPSSGSYMLRGRVVAELEDVEQSRLRNANFGFVFQQFYLLPELTAWENVARPLRYAGVSRRARKERALALLNEFGLEERIQHRPAQLSGGEQQRVAIARALVNDPEVLLADEPTGSLPQAQWQPILDTLERLNAQGRTVIMVTHEPLVAERARRQIMLQDGQIVAG